jgi:hypothetical protein
MEPAFNRHQRLMAPTEPKEPVCLSFSRSPSVVRSEP